MGEKIGEDNTSSTENIKEISRVTEIIKKELNDFNLAVFYKKDAEGKDVTYDINAAKNYLTKIKDNFQQCNCVTGIMAVQILLEKQGYDVGKIDGIVGKETRPALKKFQREHGLTPNGIINKATVQALLEGKKGGGGGGGGGNDFDEVIDDLYQRSSKEERETAKKNITMDNIEHIIDGYKQFNYCINDTILSISDEVIFQRVIERLKKIGKTTFFLECYITDLQKKHLKMCAESNIVENIRMGPNIIEETLDFLQEWRELDSSTYGEITLYPYYKNEDISILIFDFKHIQKLFQENIIDNSWRWGGECGEGFAGRTWDGIFDKNRWGYLTFHTANNNIFYCKQEQKEHDAYNCLMFNNYVLEYNGDMEFLKTLDERVNKAIKTEDFKDYNFGGISGDLEMSKTGFSLKDTVICKNAEGKLKSWGVDPKKFLKFINEYIAEAKKQKGNES